MHASHSVGNRSPRLRLGPLVMGGAGFSYQLVNDPHQAPVVDILKTAFTAGVRTIDTSPYYDPSELILGAALADPEITSRYRREDYVLMTKCGRIAADHFDYSAAWIRKSVARSLERFRTTYLDVVFCHDIEFVSVDEAVSAVGTLFTLAQEGSIKHVGISGYDLDRLIQVASNVLEQHGRPVDVVQNWAQLTLQNTRLETYGIPALESAGVHTICSASPLAVGLLRDEGVPVGGLGDWHPAPQPLREQAREAACMVKGTTGEPISALALRFAMRKAMKLCDEELSVATITGIASLRDLKENIATAQQIVGKNSEAFGSSGRDIGALVVDKELEQRDESTCAAVREILADWIDYDLSKPRE